MKAILKSLDTNSAVSLDALISEHRDCFGFWLHAAIGPEESPGADDFEIFVCNDAWMENHRGLPTLIPERHLLVDGPSDARDVQAQLESFLEGCVGETWSELVAKVSEIGFWEFEGYH